MDLTISIDWRHGHKSGSFGSTNLPWTDFKLLLGLLLSVSKNPALNRKFYKLLNPNYSLEIPVWNFLISRVVLEKVQGALLDLIPWIAALYFIIKSLQASAAQAYASLRQSGTPDFIVGYISNISTSDNQVLRGYDKLSCCQLHAHFCWNNRSIDSAVPPCFRLHFRSFVALLLSCILVTCPQAAESRIYVLLPTRELFFSLNDC